MKIDISKIGNSSDLSARQKISATAFTLIELLVVIAVIGILTAIVY
ncbi:MAG: prepilin-type N-terminal cleavage/methylation domain-containing protein, partial [Candidatus Pacebacteria bacterium]|nr:prepilin-type N-terminal cleavage/methylation domain-containing protein [Candidatus Paceibacterota bacterium]